MHSDGGLLEFVGRILIALLYLFQGVNAIGRYDFHRERLRERNVPAPGFVLAGGLAMMLVGGTMVLLNLGASLGASLLLVFTIAATLLFQNFWSISEPKRRRERRTNFMNNLAIIGGLLLVAAHGIPLLGG